MARPSFRSNLAGHAGGDGSERRERQRVEPVALEDRRQGRQVPRARAVQVPRPNLEPRHIVEAPAAPTLGEERLQRGAFAGAPLGSLRYNGAVLTREDGPRNPVGPEVAPGAAGVAAVPGAIGTA